MWQPFPEPHHDGGAVQDVESSERAAQHNDHAGSELGDAIVVWDVGDGGGHRDLHARVAVGGRRQGEDGGSGGLVWRFWRLHARHFLFCSVHPAQQAQKQAAMTGTECNSK